MIRSTIEIETLRGGLRSEQREQWEKLLGMADEIRTFIRENNSALKAKE